VNEVNIPSGIESNNVIKLFVGHVEPVYMVDNEPIVDNSEICRSIASIDESRIWATAIIESGTIIGYYYNNNINPTRSEEEQPEIKGTELQNIIRSTGDQLADTASTTSTNLTRSMHHILLHKDSLDILAFPMPYAGNPPRILVIVSKVTADYLSLIDAVRSRLEQMGT
jgi:hypothetical protein